MSDLVEFAKIIGLALVCVIILGAAFVLMFLVIGAYLGAIGAGIGFAVNMFCVASGLCG